MTDIHGIVPEEERMMGRPAHGDFYEAVEATVMLSSRLLVVVTEAMRDHLVAKYPECRAEFIIAPIIEPHAIDLTARRIRKPGGPYRAIYAGGTQAWQNIDETLAIASSVKDICTFDFLSQDHEQITAQAAPLGLQPASSFRVVNKDELADAYLNSDFGFVLRDPVAVNRVSCPTKLSEYLWFGVIPVVKSPSIGDFDALGFAYLTMEDFAAGLFPDEAALSKMREKNRAVIQQLSTRFADAAAALGNLILPNRIAGSGLAGLPVGDRHLIFPNQAEAYLFGDVMHYARRDVAEAYTLMDLPLEGVAKSARIVPLLADARLRFLSIELEVEGAEAPTVMARCAGTLEKSADGAAVLCLKKSASHLDLAFDRPIHVRRIRYEVRFDSLSVLPACAAKEQCALTVPVRFTTRVGAFDRLAPITAAE